MWPSSFFLLDAGILCAIQRSNLFELLTEMSTCKNRTRAVPRLASEGAFLCVD